MNAPCVGLEGFLLGGPTRVTVWESTVGSTFRFFFGREGEGLRSRAADEVFREVDAFSDTCFRIFCLCRQSKTMPSLQFFLGSHVDAYFSPERGFGSHLTLNASSRSPTIVPVQVCSPSSGGLYFGAPSLDTSSRLYLRFAAMALYNGEPQR